MLTITSDNLNKIQDALMSAQAALGGKPGSDAGSALAAVIVAQGLVVTAKDGAASQDLRDAAEAFHGSDNVEIDDEASTSPADDGTWVSAWVWVPRPECSACHEKPAGEAGEDCGPICETCQREADEEELREAWEGQGNGGEFGDWVQNMADDPRGTLQDTARRFLESAE